MVSDKLYQWQKPMFVHLRREWLHLILINLVETLFRDTASCWIDEPSRELPFKQDPFY